MDNLSAYKSSIFNIDNDADFERHALWAFHYQAEHCLVYKQYIEAISVDPVGVKTIADIPFLPVQFFKTYEISDGQPYSHTFTSSGTTGSSTSKHHVSDINIYETSYRRAFDGFYGSIEKYTTLALLPSYLEREGSSLIYMVEDLIKQSNSTHSGFYLNNLDALHEKLLLLEKAGTPTILIGVSYALLDFAERYPMKLKYTIVMETGGMKGKRKEMVREELHQYLCSRFGISEVHSEYGMTELLSQAYSYGCGIYTCPPWMKILIRDANDPFIFLDPSSGGGINIIDLANIHSCCFIATQDLGKAMKADSFEVLGRFDNSDIRGCNLLIV